MVQGTINQIKTHSHMSLQPLATKSLLMSKLPSRFSWSCTRERYLFFTCEKRMLVSMKNLPSSPPHPRTLPDYVTYFEEWHSVRGHTSGIYPFLVVLYIFTSIPPCLTYLFATVWLLPYVKLLSVDKKFNSSHLTEKHTYHDPGKHLQKLQ